MENPVHLKIDGRPVVVGRGVVLLEVARSVGIEIPALCHNRQLEAYGGCRMCMVEIELPNQPARLVISCAYPAEEGLEVTTRSERLSNIRKTLAELSGPLAAREGCLKGKLRRIAEDYGADPLRYAAKSTPAPNGCTLCGLCVGTCSQSVGAYAIGFVGRGIERQVAYFPATGCEYRSCKKCFSVCFTGKIASEAAEHVFPGAAVEDYLTAHGVKVHTLRSLLEAQEKHATGAEGRPLGEPSETRQVE